MNDHAGQTISIWMTTATLPLLSALIKSEHGDACILDAGIAGLSPCAFVNDAASTQRNTHHPFR
jgi:hypothetical protein